MSETIEGPEVAGNSNVLEAPAPADQPDQSEPVDEPRPWHGAASPFEALYQHFTAEIAKLKSLLHKDEPAADAPAPAAPAADAPVEDTAAKDEPVQDTPADLPKPDAELATDQAAEKDNS